MKRIQLTKAQVALIDDNDLQKVSVSRWWAKWNEKTQSYYAMRHPKDGEKHIYMHRLIMDTPDDRLCDHANHNTLDNRKENLRNCTRSQNQMNRKTQRNNQLGVKGVSPDGDKFRAQLMVDRKHALNQTFPTLEEAAAAYADAARKHHGEFYNSKEQAQQ